MGDKEKQIGPIMKWCCEGCYELNTWNGENDSHHTCPAGGWKSINSTKLGTYPDTPDTCPFMK